MPKSLSRIMLNRRWASPSAPQLANSVGGWMWLQTFLGGDRRVPADAAWWSRIVPPHTILRLDRDSLACMVISVTAWGVLTWPLDCLFDSGDASIYSLCLVDQPVKWAFVTAPDDVARTPYKAIGPAQASLVCIDLGSGGIVLQQTGPPISLYMATLERNVPLVVDSLQKILTRIKVPCSNQDKRGDLKRAVAVHVFQGLPDAKARVEAVLDAAPEALVVDDDDKAVMDELAEHDLDFKADLRDMDKAYRKRKLRELQGLRDAARVGRKARRARLVAKRGKKRLQRKIVVAAAAVPAPPPEPAPLLAPGGEAEPDGDGLDDAPPLEDDALALAGPRAPRYPNVSYTPECVKELLPLQR